MFFNKSLPEQDSPHRFLVSVEEGEFSVRASCADFPGCIVEARTVDAALDELRRLIISHLDAIREDLAEIVGFE